MILSTTPIGEAVAMELARSLRDSPRPFKRIHGAYNGHTLCYEEQSWKVLQVDDEYEPFNTVIFATTDLAEFVQFMAIQSDFSLSGMSPQAPAFFTADPFLVNNQRITRKQIQQYLKSQHQSRGPGLG